MLFGERLSASPEVFVAYSGTTVGNFRINAYVNALGSVEYDKRRNKLHKFSDIFFAGKPEGTLNPTCQLASRQNEMPIVMVGELDVFHEREMALPVGEVFPVSELWVLEEGQQGFHRLQELLRDREQPFLARRAAMRSLFVYRDPVSYLESLNS